MTEQRSKPRFDDKSIVSIKARRSSGDARLSQFTLFCFTRDISVAGLSFTAHFPLAVGTKLNLTVAFSNPTRSAKNITGTIAWVKRVPNGTQHVMGVDLSASEPESLNNWKKLVSERVTSE